MSKTLIPWCALLLLAACGDDSSASGAGSNPPAGNAPTVVRMSAIPDFNKAEMAEYNNKLAAYLQQETGVRFEFAPSNDYTASVNNMVAGQFDLVWYGGVTAVEIEQQLPGKVTFVACRDIDKKFHSYFIANKAAIDAGKIKPVDNVADLKPMLNNCSFTFGSKKSTSGHVMPRHFLVQAGIDPESAFRGAPAYQKDHAAVMTAVMNGAVDAGVVNYSHYDKSPDKSQMPIVCTTPDYVDYCFVANNKLGSELIGKIRTALTKLSSSDPEQAKILEAWGAGSFVAADAKEWEGIRQVLKNLPKTFF